MSDSDDLDGPKRLPWGVKRRLEFIDFRLYWEGGVNRADLRGRFGISIPQASSDLALYNELCPGNLVYDSRAKSYVASDGFKPCTSQSARKYLAQLRLRADGALEPQDMWLSERPPPFDTVPLVRRRLDDPEPLRRVLAAIRQQHALYVHYESMTPDSPAWRWITPHALAFDGWRWHTRAWCDTRKHFGDFVLSRIVAVAQSKRYPLDPNADRAWFETITLRIAPSRQLTEPQKRTIEHDFGMENGELALPTRICLAYYVVRQLMLDIEPNTKDPQRFPLTLLNADELRDAQQRIHGLGRRTSDET